MASRREPPRPSQHSPSCPAYSVSAKYSSCTCGLTTPRKRPTIEQATVAAHAVEVAESEAERKSRELREAMEAAIFSPGTTNQKQVSAACPRCSECIGQKHHWIEAAVYDENDPSYECKHCDAACGMRSDGAPNGKLMPRRPDDEIPDPWVSGEVDAVIAAGDRVVAASQVGSGYPGGGVDHTTPPEVYAAARLRRVSHAVSSMGSHRVTVIEGSGALMVEQLCLVCRSNITSGAPSHDTEIETIAAVGISARKARLKHRCDPIETQLPAAMTRAELEQLAQELERDGTKMVDRSIAVAKLAKERTDGA